MRKPSYASLFLLNGNHLRKIVVIFSNTVLPEPLNLNAMNCLINNAIDFNLRKGRKIEVIHRYLRLKYRVKIDNFSIAKRMKALNIQY